MLQTIRSLGRAFGGAQGALSVLMYHRVLAQADAMQPGVHTVQLLDKQFDTLRRYFTVLPLNEAVEMLAQGRLPARAVALSFDDGYRDNHDLALPVLKRHGLQATFYIASGYLNGGIIFNDLIVEAARLLPSGQFDLGVQGIAAVHITDAASRKHAADQLLKQMKYLQPEQRELACMRLRETLGPALTREMMMDDAHVLAMHRAGMSIGGHTVNHPILAKVDPAQAAIEIAANRQALQAITGVAPVSFAYPNGKPTQDFGPREVELVRQLGYANAVSTQVGVATKGTSAFEVPRFVLNESKPHAIVMRMLSMMRFPIRHEALAA